MTKNCYTCGYLQLPKSIMPYDAEDLTGNCFGEFKKDIWIPPTKYVEEQKKCCHPKDFGGQYNKFMQKCFFWESRDKRKFRGAGVRKGKITC